MAVGSDGLLVVAPFRQHRWGYPWLLLRGLLSGYVTSLVGDHWGALTAVLLLVAGAVLFLKDESI
jgi:hypothetical protein